MTFHTLEVSCMLSNERYYKIQDELKSKDKSKWKSEKKGMTYYGLSDKGILIHMFQIKKKGYYAYTVKYRISARRVMENNNYIGLFDTGDYSELEEQVNELLNSKSKHLPKLSKCCLSRFDFCINAELENQEQVKAYIDTAKRANIPTKLELFEAYDKTAKRSKPLKDDFTVYASEYVAVSVYNKYAQMMKENKKTKNAFPEKEINRAKNIVRIEIRCMDGKIKALKKKYKIESIHDFMRIGNVIGNELFRYYLPKMFGSGEICTLKSALTKIDASEYKRENCKLLKEFIEHANDIRSVYKAVKDFKSYYKKIKINRIFYLLDNIDTNYVTATDKACKAFMHGFIPTPIELFEKFNN